jgi:serine/threonine-protein kinase
LAAGAAAVLLAVAVLAAAFLVWHQRRQASLERAVGKDLLEAELLQQQERWPEALQALERAEGRLTAGAPAALRERVQSLRDAVAWVADLEEAQLQMTALRRGYYDLEGADRAYGASFSKRGWDLDALSTEEAARRIRALPIRAKLVAALDHWSALRDRRKPGSGERLRAVARRADDDRWRQKLRDPQLRKDRKALQRLADSDGALGQPPVNLILLAETLQDVGGEAAAEGLLRRAQKRYPGDFGVSFQLADILTPLPPSLVFTLPGDSAEAARAAEAVGFYRAALALRPRSAAAWNGLGIAWTFLRKLPEAAEAYREAVVCNGDYATARSNLGAVLVELRQFAEAEVQCRKALALEPRLALAHNELGVVLLYQNRPGEAEKAFRQALRLRPGVAGTHHNLAKALEAQGKLPEYLAELREAIKLNPQYVTYLRLGDALCKQKQWVEAEKVYRQAIGVYPSLPNAHRNLGVVLRQQGRFAEALAAHHRCQELSRREPHLGPKAARAVAESRRLVALDAKLPKVLKGESQPTSPSEQLELAWFCQTYKALVLTAARFYGEAFTAQPELADDLQRQCRFDAACAAAQAGCGQGKDTGNLAEEERARLRRQALDWLRADLKAYRQLMEKSREKAGPMIAQRMQHWLQDADFAGMRGEGALAKLPEAERDAWKKLWTAVEELRQRADGGK